MTTTIRKKRPTIGRGNQQIKQELISEQSKLVEAQKKLRALITSIDQKLNVLKVEELQIRSNSIATNIEQGFKSDFQTKAPKNYDFDQTADDINKQDLDLDVFLANAFKNVEEDDDEDL